MAQEKVFSDTFSTTALAVYESFESAEALANMLWSSVFVTLVAKKYRFMQFELDMVFDTR